MESLQGHFLVAAPTLTDPNFFHTVLLIVQHNDNGALGLVLNRPLSTPVRKVWEQVAESDCLIEGMVHQGGPCEGPLMVVHGDPDASDLEILPGLHFTTNKDSIGQLVEAGSDPTRFFIGYAGWTSGQLEAEMEQSSWLVLEADVERVFEGSDEDLWHALHRQATRASLGSWIPPEIMPDDPSLN